jgi:hypothetical protein
MLDIEDGDGEGVALAQRANALERRILKAVQPIANGEDARAVCAAMMMASSAIARHVGMPPAMFAHLAETAAEVNQDILAGRSPEQRARPN